MGSELEKDRRRSKAIAVITTHHNKEKSSLGPE